MGGMPLPTDPKQPWPPKQWQQIARDIDEADAWYSGDEAKLISFYGGPANTATRGTSGWWSRFWSRRSLDQSTGRQRIQASCAAGIVNSTSSPNSRSAATAATSAAAGTCYSRFSVASAAACSSPTGAGVPSSAGGAYEIAEHDGWASTLLEAAEIASGITVADVSPATAVTLRGADGATNCGAVTGGAAGPCSAVRAVTECSPRLSPLTFLVGPEL